MSEINRRDFLKGVLGSAATLAVPGILSSCAKEMSTERIYGKDWFNRAKQDLEEIEKLNRNIKSPQAMEAKKMLENFYIDPVLQEFPTLQKKGIIKGNSIRVGDYQINVLDYQGPTETDRGKYSDTMVKVELFYNGQKIDLDPMPFTESAWLNLKTKDWSVKKIRDTYK